ncbi:MAG: sialidase family protein, partial [bacterium]
QGKLLSAWNGVAYISSDNGATFTQVTIAAGENIMSYAASKTVGTIYAVTRNDSTGVSKLHISVDGGVTWAAMMVDASNPFTNVNANPYDANILTLSNDNALWLSTNAGAVWTKMGVSPARSCGTFSLWTSTRWYACAGSSTDNGTSWVDFDTHTNVMRGPGKVVVVNAADETILYGDCMSGVCKSTDGGLTWHNSLDGITGVNVLAISQTTNKSTVWIASSNGLGKTDNFTSAAPDWTWPILPCDPDPAARCDSSGIGESVWVKPDNANIVLAGSIGGWIYRSTNGGTTWTAQIPSVVNVAKFKTGSWNNLRPKHFINDPADPNTVYLAMFDPIDHNGAVLKSTDAGVTWADLAIADDAPATVLSRTTTGVLYAGTGEGKSTTTVKGVYKYENSAWTKLTGIDTRLNIMSVMVDPEVQTTVYAAASNDLAPLQEDGFYKSIDSGVTWTKIVPTGYTDFGTITVQRSTLPNTLYMSAIDSATHGVLLKSSDAGATWGILYTGLKSETYTSALFDGLVAGNKHGVFGIKSKVEFKSLASKKIQKGKTALISTTLRDKATKKLLKNKKVTLYKKVGKVWKFQSTHTTNSKGLVRFITKPSKTAQYRLVWKPVKTDKAEYASLTSNVITVTVKK